MILVGKITGKEFGSDNITSLAGASIRVSGTTRGTTADHNGSFALEVYPGETIVLSYIGYSPMDYVVKSNDKSILIELQQQSNSIPETTITGTVNKSKRWIWITLGTIAVSAFLFKKTDQPKATKVKI